MAITNTPGVQIDEVRLGPVPIAGVGTSTPGFVGAAPTPGSHTGDVRLVTSRDQFLADYCAGATASTPLSRAVIGFFDNGGPDCYVVNVDSAAPADVSAGLDLLAPNADVEIIAAPGHTEAAVYDALISQASNLEDRFALLDPPAMVTNLADLLPGGASRPPTESMWAAFYYPRVSVGPQSGFTADPATEFVTPIGHIAGIYARVDATRGVHKAPANEVILNVLGVEHPLTDNDQNPLNNDSVNIIRPFTTGPTVWGARTYLDHTADQTFRYVNVRRLVTYIEQSLKVGLRPYVFEPNNLPTRQQITRSISDFLTRIWVDGGLFGATAKDAFYVRFPDTLNTPAAMALGQLWVEVGLRASYPAEFIIVRIGLVQEVS